MPSIRQRFPFAVALCTIFLVVLPLCHTLVVRSSFIARRSSSQPRAEQTTLSETIPTTQRLHHHRTPAYVNEETPSLPLSSRSLLTSTSTTAHAAVSAENIAPPAALEADVESGKLVPVARAGNCYCGPKQDFTQRYNKAYASVRCVVVEKKIVSGEGTITEYVEYKFRSQARYKGPASLETHNTFRVRAWSNPDFCGLTFNRYVIYFMYLPNPNKNSIAGNAGRGVYIADQCTKAYTWTNLPEDNKNFLRAKRRQLQ